MRTRGMADLMRIRLSSLEVVSCADYMYMDSRLHLFVHRSLIWGSTPRARRRGLKMLMQTPFLRSCTGPVAPRCSCAT